MRSSKQALIVAATILCAATAQAARVDMTDPRRALALDDDVRIDAQLAQDTIASGTSVSVTFQVQNNTNAAVALADKVADSSYDAETQTITISIGSEIPTGAAMPHLALVKSGEKRTFTSGVPIHVALPSARSPFVAYPRYVLVKVNILRDVAPFAALIAQQHGATTPPLPDALFDTWLQSNDAILLNAIPVHWKGGHGVADQNGADLAAPITSSVSGGGTF